MGSTADDVEPARTFTRYGRSAFMKPAMKALSATWLALGIAIGVAIGAAMGNIGMGIGAGIALGIALGLALNSDPGTTDPKPKPTRGDKELKL